MNRLRKQTDKHVSAGSRVLKKISVIPIKGMAVFSYKPLQNSYMP